MKTEYIIFTPGHASGEWHEIDWPVEPGYDRIAKLIEPLLGEKEPLEHVTVLYEGRRADMFVSEYGHMTLTHREPLPINDRATEIYRAAWLSRHPKDDPATLPSIAGVAVLFTRIVWV